MKVAPELIFPGARVKLGEDDFTIIKVNAKSFYATTMSFSEFTEKYNNKQRGITFTAFCKTYGINQYKYTDGFEIEKTDFNSVEIKKNENTSYKLEEYEKKIIIDTIVYLRSKKRKIKLSPLIEVGKKKVFFLEELKNCFLANIDNNYILFDIDADEWIKISTVYDYKEKYNHVPWEILKKFANEKVKVTA